MGTGRRSITGREPRLETLGSRHWLTTSIQLALVAGAAAVTAGIHAHAVNEFSELELKVHYSTGVRRRSARTLSTPTCILMLSIDLARQWCSVRHAHHRCYGVPRGSEYLVRLPDIC